jgi:hypothetical protein
MGQLHMHVCHAIPGAARGRGRFARSRLLATLLAVLAAPVGAFEVPLVVTQARAGAEPTARPANSLLRADLGAGARLVLVRPGGTLRVLSEGFESACEPDVSWDGERILFAGKKAASDPWNVFELTLDGGQVRQVTRDLGDCRQPIYESSFYTITEKEPWDQIGFLSAASGQVNECGGAPATSLYTCRLDGSFPQRITYNLSSDLDAAILPDGRLVYSSWHRATLDDGPLGRIALESINVDGSDRAPFAPPGGPRVCHMPCVTTGGLVVFVETAAASWDGAGGLASVTLRRPLHSYRAITEPADGLSCYPAPMPDGRILVSRRPADGSHGVFALDPDTKRVEPVFDDPAYHDIQAKAVVPRKRPDGRSSVVSERDETAKLYGLDLYTTDFPERDWLPRGSVKSLRVIEGLPGRDLRPDGSPLALRRVLAEVPVSEEGSFHLTVPANTPIQLQILDGKGLALRSCGWIWARSHQAQACIGCHEDPERTPPNILPEAISSEAVSVLTTVEKRATVDYRHDVAPIVAAKCAGCHGEGGSAPLLTGDPHAAFETILASKSIDAGRARTSPLVRHVLGRNPARPWDGDTVRAGVTPIPDGPPHEPLSDSEIHTLIRWIDLGAPWDAHPTDAGRGR